MRRFIACAVVAALMSPVSGYASLLPQNDAGSGQDAPNVPTASFTIEPGVVYEGTIEGFFALVDDEDFTDFYAFDATAGETIDAAVSSPLGCLYLYHPDGTQLTFSCTEAYLVGRATAVAPVTGTYYIEYTYVQPHTYRFALGIDEIAPSPAPADGLELTPPTPGALPSVAPASQADDNVVVAVIDTGINPYHDFFAAPALTDHPSTWVPDFPADATTVNLSLDETGYATARAADTATWTGVQRSTWDRTTDTFDSHLYTFPGTRVIGGISFGEYEDIAFPVADPRPVLDDNGHGTHSAGLVGGATLGSADGNVLFVAVEVGKGFFDQGIRWAAQQPWIDALSISLGHVANSPGGRSATGDRVGVEWSTREAVASGKPVFVASGNGVSNSGLAPDKCSTYTSEYVGPSWVTRVGAAEPADGSPTWWHCVPVDTVGKTNVLSVNHDAQTGGSKATGTSAATPNVAGHWAHLMLAARRAGSAVTRLEAVDYLLHSAQPAATSAGTHDPSVYPLSLADQGYGLVSEDALDAATTRLLASSGPAPRPETEDWFARDRAIRDEIWGPGSVTAQPPLPEI